MGLLIAELVLRVFDLRPERYPYPKWLALGSGTFKERGMWGGGLIKQPCRIGGQEIAMGEYVPGATMKVVYGGRGGEFDDKTGVVMRINSLGFRGPETTVEKKAGTYRVLGLGDSFTFGVGAEDEQTFLRRLEASLNAKWPSKEMEFEVLNVGVQGYNTRDEVLCLEHRWLKFAPDLVLITFYLNDAYSDQAFLNRGQGLGIYLTEPEGLGRYSRLFDFAQHAYRSRLMRQEMDEYYAKHYFTQPAEYFSSPTSRNVDWHDCREALERAKQLTDEHNMKLALVIFPELHQLDDYPFRSLHTIVSKACRSLDIEVLDLIDTFEGMNERDLWCHPSDHHPNAEAHRIASEAIDPFLREQILMRSDPPGHD